MRRTERFPATERNELEALKLQDWLGGRDSSAFARLRRDKNPDNVVQRGRKRRR